MCCDLRQIVESLFHRLNRIGNLLVPNSNYCAFEDWVLPILDKLREEQDDKEEKRWTPSEVINRLGKEIDNEESVYYWCYKVSLLTSLPHYQADSQHITEQYPSILSRSHRWLLG